MRWCISVLLMLVAYVLHLPQARCSDVPVATVAASPPPELNNTDPLHRPDSIFVFAGALSTSSLGSTLKFNLDQPAGSLNYDNFIAGAAYNRNFYYLGLGFVLGAEIGVADRFGHYVICCNTIVKS